MEVVTNNNGVEEIFSSNFITKIGELKRLKNGIFVFVPQNGIAYFSRTMLYEILNILELWNERNDET